MKTSRILIASAVLCMMATGCHKGPDPSVPKQAEINATVSGEAVYEDETTEAFTWTSESTIGLISPSKTVQYEISAGSGSRSGKFTGEDLEGAAKYAVSPFTTASYIGNEEGAPLFSFDFPTRQIISKAINSTELVTPNDVKVLVATSAKGTVELENVAAFVRIPVGCQGTCHIDSVEVYCSDANITGKSVVSLSDGKTLLEVSGEGSHSSRIVFSQPIAVISDTVYVTVPVAPVKTFGIRVGVYSTQTVGIHKKIDETFYFEAGKVYTLDVVDCNDTRAILTDGPDFNSKIKELASRVSGKKRNDKDSDLVIYSISFHTDSQMPNQGDNTIDLSAGGDGSVLGVATLNEEFESDGLYDIDIYTEAANFSTLNTANMFSLFGKLVEINGLEKLNTYGATMMKRMFASAAKVRKLDLSSFNNANAMAFDSMFFRCENLEELQLGDNFITSKAIRAVALFNKCYKLKSVDVSKLDVSNCTSISQMFQNCEAMEEIVCPLDASGCTSISQMFYQCKKARRIDISKMKTSSKLISTRYMFYQCNALEDTLDFTNFYTLRDTCFYRAFCGLGKIKAIKVGDNFNINAALKRAESKTTPLQEFFGSSSTASSTSCYVGAGMTPENPTVIICPRMFLQLLIKDPATTCPQRIQMKYGYIKFVNYNGNPYKLRLKGVEEEIPIPDMNVFKTDYIVVDPDEKK